MFIDFRVRGREGRREKEERDREVERQREKTERGKHQLVASHKRPDWGSNLKPGYAP